MAIKIKSRKLKLHLGGIGDYTRFDLVKPKALSSDDIAVLIEKETGIPAIEVMTVLRSFYWRASEELLNGKAIDIKDFGVLLPMVTGTEKTAPGLKVTFRAKGDLKKCLSKAEFEEIAE